MEAVARLSVLIDYVLVLTQSDSGSLRLVDEQVDLETLFAESAEVARAGAERKNIEFVLELSPSVGVVIGDRSRLHQALEHILKNAVAYTERSEEHTSELQSLMRISYAVFCLKKKQEAQDT